MARIELHFPEPVAFTTNIVVSVMDINYGNHLGNDRVLGYLHEARIRFFESLGYLESDIEGVSLIQADTAVVYQSEAFYKDAIQINIGLGDFSRAGFELYYQLYNLTQQKNTALAKTGMVCFDYKERKVKSVPDKFKLACEKLKNTQA